MRVSICFAVLMLAAFCTGRENRHAGSSSHDDDEWPRLDEFHFLMAESFHPYADSGNLAPARKYAREMADLAEAWTKDELPAKVDNDEVKALLTRLDGNTAGFAAVASTGDEAQVGDSLRALHDLFHQIQEHWYETDADHPPH